jgi:hypothetical protein
MYDHDLEVPGYREVEFERGYTNGERFRKPGQRILRHQAPSPSMALQIKSLRNTG